MGGARNDDVLVSVDSDLVHRDCATVSAFASRFVLDDGVWEGLRPIDGRIVFLDAHLDRLYDRARMLLFEGLDTDGMAEGKPICLMVMQGKKRSPCQDSRLTIGPVRW